MAVIIPAKIRDEELREYLISEINRIDQTKRDIKLQIHTASNQAKELRTHVNQAWLRSAKGKMRHLTREREEIRQFLGDVNARIRKARVRTNGLNVSDYALEFVQVASEILAPEIFEHIEDVAASRAARKIGSVRTGEREVSHDYGKRRVAEKIKEIHERRSKP